MTNKNVPEVRFDGFSGEWKPRKLSDVARYRNGKAHEKNIHENGQYVVVNSKFVSSNGNVKKYCKFLIEPLTSGEIAFVLSDVPNGRALARTYIIESCDKYSLNQRIAGIKPNEDTGSYFLSILMNRNKYFLKFDSGVGQTNLSRQEVESFSEYYPTYHEQQKIGQFFKQLDDRIALQQQQIDLLKKSKQGFLQKMFPKDGERVPEVRFEGFLGEWEISKLSSIAEFSKGRGYTKKDLTENGCRIILYGQLYTNYQTIISEVDTYVESTDNAVVSQYGDVIVPSSGETSEEISRASVVNLDGVVLGGDLNIIRTCHNILSPVFLALTISNGTEQKELIKRAQGKSVVHLHNSDLMEVKVSIPEIQEQQKIGEFFKQLDDTIALHEKELELLKETKKGFLQKMFV